MRSVYNLALAVVLVFSAMITAHRSHASPSAPEWDVSQWLNTDPLKLSELRGRVVVIEFFQLWCPGCNKFTIPLMKHWHSVFARELHDEKLVIVSIHTVFEGHNYQTPMRLRGFIREKGIIHPVGIDNQLAGGRIPETMRRYRTSGTPEVVLVGKQGQIRFQRFGYFDPDGAANLVRKLLAE